MASRYKNSLRPISKKIKSMDERGLRPVPTILFWPIVFSVVFLVISALPRSYISCTNFAALAFASPSLLFHPQSLPINTCIHVLMHLLLSHFRIGCIDCLSLQSVFLKKKSVLTELQKHIVIQEHLMAMRLQQCFLCVYPLPE